MPNRTDCAREECACLVEAGLRYCSEYCRKAGEADRKQDLRDPGQLRATGHGCNCGHAECEDRVKSGQATHEQAR